MMAMSAISQRTAARTLRFTPQADLANFDPIWSFAYPPRNAGVLVWDTLYGMDANLQIQRQMVEAEEVSPDELTLDVPSAAGPQVPRWRASAGERRHCESQALVGAAFATRCADDSSGVAPDLLQSTDRQALD
jgi:hypothetical protein